MHLAFRPFTQSILIGLFLASPTLAQVAGQPVVIPAAAPATDASVVSPFAGEHATFTRVVVRLPAGAEWAVTPEGRDRRISVANVATRFDVSRLFDRIPRGRLSDARDDSGDLLLTMGCDCTIRAWEERPGLLVLDISGTADAATARTPIVVPATPIVIPGTPEPLTAEEVSTPSVAPAPALRLPRPNIDALAAGRAAGAALARLMPPPTEEPAPPAEDDPRLQTLAQDLGRSVAAALGQGLLEASADTDPSSLGLMEGTDTAEMPANMRISTVLDRSRPEEAPAPALPESCVGGADLDALMTKDIDNFTSEYGRLSSELYGEFDQPNPRARAELIGLYLAAGFGAEARALLENAADSVPARDLAIGVADVLEDRASNSRMRLAQAVDCGGTVSVMAVLAGAPQDRVQARADQLALSFINLPPALRNLTGLPLATALADAGAMDAARIVADALHRSPWVDRPALALVEARLDTARGLPGDAAARLAHEGGNDPVTMQTRLDLALDNHGTLDPAYLADAEAVAAGTRGQESGPEMMASVIRLHARSGALPDAFEALDRLETWMATTGENQRLLSELRDTVWDALASNGTDFGLVEAVLAREDWRDGGLSEGTRRKLADRLLDLGFATPVEDLIGNLNDEPARVTRARALLARNEPQAALEMINGFDGTDAREVRASALEQLGDHATAAEEFSALGQPDAAARSAILASDWRRVETLRNADVLPPAAGELGQMLGRAPGHAEVAIEQVQQEAQQAPADHGVPAATPVSAQPLAAADHGAAPVDTHDAPVETVAAAFVPAPPLPDASASFDRMGLVRRSSTLLAESERLRDALAPLVTAGQ